MASEPSELGPGPVAKITRWPEAHLVFLYKTARENPERFSGWTFYISSSGNISVRTPSGRTYVSREAFPRGARDLAWLSRVRPYVRRLAEISTEDFRRKGYIVVDQVPPGIFRSLHRLDGEPVVYVDIAQAYWRALNHIYRDFFGTEIPVSTDGVPKHIRNAAWGILGARKTIVRFAGGEIRTEQKAPPRPAVFWAVPWLVRNWLAEAAGVNRDMFRGLYWVDCVVVPREHANKVLSVLAEYGLDTHIIEGVMYLDGTGGITIVDPATGEVAKEQRWAPGLISRTYKRGGIVARA